MQGSDGLMVYIVDVVGAHLICNCPAAADGNYCYHRAVVTRCLLGEDSGRTAYDGHAGISQIWPALYIANKDSSPSACVFHSDTSAFVYHGKLIYNLN